MAAYSFSGGQLAISEAFTIHSLQSQQAQDGKLTGAWRQAPREPEVALGAAYFGKKKSKADLKKEAKKAALLAQKEQPKKKVKENVIELEGEVLLHAGSHFKVMLVNGAEVQCTLAGKVRINKIKIMEGDRVTVEMSPFDLTRGRITFRSINKDLLKSDTERREEAKALAKAEKKLADKEEREREKEDAAAAAASE